ncbi:MAG: N-acetyltransferase [Moraxellaceae bacterium]|nr:MAG: N-acetyltransferase [Moraxellaceae bacterium]
MLDFRPATLQDADALVALINRAYRPETGQEGWTHESGCIIQPRINLQQLQDLLQDPASHLLVTEVLTGQNHHRQIAGCVLLQFQYPVLQIGLLTVDPNYQTQQIGRQLLDYAEQQGRQIFQPHVFEMSVVHTRQELIAYYERRGYQHTGQIKPYPHDQNVGIPKIPLHLIIMQKPA